MHRRTHIDIRTALPSRARPRIVSVFSHPLSCTGSPLPGFPHAMETSPGASQLAGIAFRTSRKRRRRRPDFRTRWRRLNSARQHVTPRSFSATGLLRPDGHRSCRVSPGRSSARRRTARRRRFSRGRFPTAWIPARRRFAQNVLARSGYHRSRCPHTVAPWYGLCPELPGRDTPPGQRRCRISSQKLRRPARSAGGDLPLLSFSLPGLRTDGVSLSSRPTPSGGPIPFAWCARHRRLPWTRSSDRIFKEAAASSGASPSVRTRT